MSSPGDRRTRAAQARTEARATEVRRARIIRITAISVVVVVIAAVVGIALVARSGSDDKPVNPSATLPKGVYPDTYAVPVGEAARTNDESVPLLEVWEDFQCPFCADLEAANGANIRMLADTGKVRLLWRPTTFLDGKFGNDASLRATAAWGCAIDAGKEVEYHSTVFANQPTVEGAGFTDEQLLQFGKDTGMDDATYATFEKCVAANTYVGWAQNSQAQYKANGVPGTPTGYVDGVELPAGTLNNQAALEAAIAAATPTPSPSGS